MNKEREVKQVILMRNDLKKSNGCDLNVGKLISQGAHASLGAVLKLMEKRNIQGIGGEDNIEERLLRIERNSYLDKWINGIFTKITLKVESLDELLELYNKANDAGIPTCLIEDRGLTEFDGVKTITCAAIGCYWADEIDKITRHLKLY
jgi:PTH2 family peptidyl-tRNA hydrolase